MSTQKQNLSTQIIAEKWLTIPDSARLFIISEKTVRRTIKRLLLQSSPLVKREVEAGQKEEDGQLFIATERAYKLWQPRPDQLEIIREMGRQPKEVSTQKPSEVGRQFEDLSTQEEVIRVDKEKYQLFKKGFYTKDRAVEDFREKDKELQRVRQSFQRVIRDAQEMKGKFLKERDSVSKRIKALNDQLAILRLKAGEKEKVVEEGEVIETKEEIKE